MAEEHDALDAAYRRMQSWVDEAYEEWEKGGGLEELPGKGKPLVVPTGDVLETIMKNAGVKPPWIMLKEETKALMAQALSMLVRTPDAPGLDELIKDINRNIEEMNALAPSLSLHRRKVVKRTLREQFERWK